MDQVQFWIRQQTQRFEGNCRSAQQQINGARTLAAVVMATNVSVPPELRALRHTVPAYKIMISAAEARMKQIVEEHLKILRETESAEACKAKFGQYVQREWQSLRGLHGHLYRLADHEGRKILHQKQMEVT